MKQRGNDVFVVFANINEDGDHSADNIIIQASGDSFGTFDMTSVHGEKAFDLYKTMKNIVRG